MVCVLDDCVEKRGHPTYSSIQSIVSWVEYAVLIKWITRILLGLVAIIALIIVGIAGFIAYDLNMSAGSTELTNLTIDVPSLDIPLNAYLAEPEDDGIYPAVLLIHEWWGLRPDIIDKADRLAAEGYVVLAVDAYRGFATDAVPTALYQAIRHPQEHIDADMDAFHQYLVQLDSVDANRVAVMGFCFGGRQSVQFGVRNPDKVNAVLTYYGGNQISDSEGLAPLGEYEVAVLGIFGETDRSIPMETVQQFESSLQTLAVPHTVTVYPDVGHAFVKDIDTAGASQDAWQEGLTFLETHLRQTETS